MAAPTDAGYGETAELEKGSTGLGLSAEDPIGFDDVKNGGDHEEVQVAKKARVEKAVNGDKVTAEDVDDGVESVEKELDPELDPLLAHNGTADESEERINGDGDDEEDSVGAAAEDADDGEPADADAPAAVTSKDVSSGDVGLRTLLQEGDTTKATLVNGTEGNASHMLNGAK